MRRYGSALLAAAIVTGVAAQGYAAEDCASISATYISSVVRSARYCLHTLVPRGRSCASQNRFPNRRATTVTSLCPAGTVARLGCTARNAIVAAGLPYDNLAPAGFTHVCTTVACGNGITETGEQCDDSNLVNEDGCSATCQLESPTCAGVCADVTPTSGIAITSVRVASGLSNPVYVTAPPGDISRVFIVEQSGTIRILKWGTLLPTPFLNVAPQISAGGERGLLSMTFHPQYSSNGRFFIDYTDTSGNTVVAGYRVSGNPDIADATSGATVIGITQPFANHNGGQLAFGPDGYLYVSLGDGGSGGDPLGSGQNTGTLLGKLLRLDINGALPYAIPPTNPFAGGGGLAEIWSLGWRNPWRFSFDRLNGDIYVGDVGQSRFEEIDYEPALSPGGANYGWNVVEGNGNCYPGGSSCDQTGMTLPVLDYSHSEGCSVTGGFVYRGCAMPDLRGTYFYSDFCTAFIRTFRVVGGVATDLQDRTTDLAPGGGLNINSVSGFGEDARGELYICDLGGEVFKIVPGP